MLFNKRSLIGFMLRMFGPIMLYDGEEGGGEAWSSSLPEPVREWEEVTASDTQEKFWERMTNMRSHLGTSIRIPGEDAGDEDITKFHEKLTSKVPGLMKTPDFTKDDTLADLYAKMGRPEKAEDYVIPEIKDVNGNKVEGLDMSMAETFREIAYKAGISQAKYAEIVSSITAGNIDANAKLVETHTADMAELATEWGAAMEQNSAIVKNFAAKTDAPPAVIKALENKAIDKATMVWLHQMATKTLGKGSEFQTDETDKGVMTPDEATLKISEIMNNKEHPWWKKKDPGHKAAMKYMRSLYLLKDPKNAEKPAPGSNFAIGGAQ